jgi:hypothetical protein
LGFNAPGSHNIVDLSICHILVPSIVAILDDLRILLAALLPPGGKADVQITATETGLDIWLVADIPEEAGAALQQGLAVPPGGIPGPDDAAEEPTPAIKIDALMLALDSGGTDFSLELIGVTPSPEDAENTKTTIGTQLGGISLLAMQMLGPKALGLMGKLTPKSDGNNVIISLKLNEKELAAVKEMAEKALAGFAGPGSEAPEGFDPSDFIKEPPGPGKAAVDPGDEGEEPEKEEDGKGEDDPLELEDF